MVVGPSKYKSKSIWFLSNWFKIDMGFPIAQSSIIMTVWIIHLSQREERIELSLSFGYKTNQIYKQQENEHKWIATYMFTIHKTIVIPLTRNIDNHKVARRLKTFMNEMNSLLFDIDSNEQCWMAFLQRAYKWRVCKHLAYPRIIDTIRRTLFPISVN